MDVEEAIFLIENSLLLTTLTPIERFVFHQSWLGLSYVKMSQKSPYGVDYLKNTGSKLWLTLSHVIQKKITKKNVSLVLQEYFKNNPRNPDQVSVNNSIDSSTLTLEFPTGPVPINSRFYIPRPPLENNLKQEIQKIGCLIRIKAPEKMGKSSLLNQIIAHAEKLKYQVIYLNFNELEVKNTQDLKDFLYWFCANIALTLNLPDRLQEYWDDELGMKVSCRIYFEQYILSQLNHPLLLILNEVNSIFNCPELSKDFFPLLRHWNELSKQEEEWKKLRLLVVHSTEMYVPLRIDHSPFNVGLSVNIPPFTLKQVQELSLCHGLVWAAGKNGKEHLKPLYQLLGGHPYLTRLALYYLATHPMNIKEFVKLAPTPNGIYYEHLQKYLSLLQNEPDLLNILQRLKTEPVLAKGEQALQLYKLQRMGLIKLEGNQAQWSCELYRLFCENYL